MNVVDLKRVVLGGLPKVVVKSQRDFGQCLLLLLVSILRYDETLLMKSNDVFFNDLVGKYMSVLSEQNPVLSKTKVEIAALLQMNLNTKDIARMMDIKPKTVENHRISIRRKCDWIEMSIL